MLVKMICVTEKSPFTPDVNVQASEQALSAQGDGETLSGSPPMLCSLLCKTMLRNTSCFCRIHEILWSFIQYTAKKLASLVLWLLFIFEFNQTFTTYHRIAFQFYFRHPYRIVLNIKKLCAII